MAFLIASVSYDFGSDGRQSGRARSAPREEIMRRGYQLIAGIAAGVMIMGGSATPALAQQDYPNKAIHVAIGFAAGSGADILTRFYAAKFGELSGQSVVVGKRPGAVGVVAANVVAKSKP